MATLLPLVASTAAAIAVKGGAITTSQWDASATSGRNAEKNASVALANFRSLYHVQWNLTMAATLLFMLPVVLLFLFAQKAFVEGVTLTGVKG